MTYYHTGAEAARVVGVPYSTLQGAIEAGKLVATRHGGGQDMQIDAADLQRWNSDRLYSHSCLHRVHKALHHADPWVYLAFAAIAQAIDDVRGAPADNMRVPHWARASAQKWLEQRGRGWLELCGADPELAAQLLATVPGRVAERREA